MAQRLSAAQRKSILERDEYTCQSCGHVGSDDSISRGMEVHHVMPCIFGGTNEPDNLITLCATCHKQYDNSAGSRKAASLNKPTTPPIMFNLPPKTLEYMRKLADYGYGSQSEVIRVAIDRMYREVESQRR